MARRTWGELDDEHQRDAGEHVVQFATGVLGYKPVIESAEEEERYAKDAAHYVDQELLLRGQEVHEKIGMEPGAADFYCQLASDLEAVLEGTSPAAELLRELARGLVGKPRAPDPAELTTQAESGLETTTAPTTTTTTSEARPAPTRRTRTPTRRTRNPAGTPYPLDIIARDCFGATLFRLGPKDGEPPAIETLVEEVRQHVKYDFDLRIGRETWRLSGDLSDAHRFRNSIVQDTQAKRRTLYINVTPSVSFASAAPVAADVLRDRRRTARRKNSFTILPRSVNGEDIHIWDDALRAMADKGADLRLQDLVRIICSLAAQSEARFDSLAIAGRQLHGDDLRRFGRRTLNDMFPVPASTFMQEGRRYLQVVVFWSSCANCGRQGDPKWGCSKCVWHMFPQLSKDGQGCTRHDACNMCHGRLCGDNAPGFDAWLIEDLAARRARRHLVQQPPASAVPRGSAAAP